VKEAPDAHQARETTRPVQNVQTTAPFESDWLKRQHLQSDSIQSKAIIIKQPGNRIPTVRGNKVSSNTPNSRDLLKPAIRQLRKHERRHHFFVSTDEDLKSMTGKILFVAENTVLRGYEKQTNKQTKTKRQQHKLSTNRH